ncbi:hypothetical protein PPL_10015 [Heterostelium album PN500]|uniref:MRH domain-containing protein n=1 Tax=Heterostelium pallidum (strain ATCC 26659 / Pp 5 / PN500) TaxID=670386 RepID=D3BPX1_HETP5|nr:hypothetical protein PPL_10015 [Heterostelium album PN500]EFA76254.1 hypothetical protein PPL_10015 [Heterostelium album PN500]|eukprot:XP_020428387.1 hypothetical protein PPL_10015 [Heterostelium album PN500]
MVGSVYCWVMEGGTGGEVAVIAEIDDNVVVTDEEGGGGVVVALAVGDVFSKMIKLLTCIILLLCISFTSSQKCKVTIEGNSFDLSPLIHHPGDEDYTYTSQEGAVFYLNICNDTVGMKNPCGNDSPAYKYNPTTQQCTMLGTGNEFYSLHTNENGDIIGLIVEYKNGDMSARVGQRNHVTYLMTCGTSVGTPKVVEISEYIHTVVHWQSEYACSTRSRVNINRRF